MFSSNDRFLDAVSRLIRLSDCKQVKLKRRPRSRTTNVIETRLQKKKASENDFQLLAWIECIAYGDLHFFRREARTPQSSTPENTCASLAS